MRISDWSSDVCSSDLNETIRRQALVRFHYHSVADHQTFNGNFTEAAIAAAHHRCPGCQLGQGFDCAFGPSHGVMLVGRAEAEREQTARRSEERGVGKVCVSQCWSMWSP